MTINNFSPHLAGTLSRYFKPEEFLYLETAFISAIENGGLLEIDFERQPGISYNPRPARSALIVINDARTLNCDAVCSAIILSANYQQILEKQNSFTKETLTISNLASKGPYISISSQNPLSSLAAIVSISLWLDRARHLHQASTANKTQLLENFIKETDDYLALAEITSKPLHILLYTWKERFCKKLSRSK